MKKVLLSIFILSITSLAFKTAAQVPGYQKCVLMSSKVGSKKKIFNTSLVNPDTTFYLELNYSYKSFAYEDVLNPYMDYKYSIKKGSTFHGGVKINMNDAKLFPNKIMPEPSKLIYSPKEKSYKLLYYQNNGGAYTGYTSTEYLFKIYREKSADEDNISDKK